ncbi:unnamed protein product, partial [Closterium sp. Naga37s-1]
ASQVWAGGSDGSGRHRGGLGRPPRPSHPLRLHRPRFRPRDWGLPSGGSAGTPGRARGRDGRLIYSPAGAHDVSGAEEAVRGAQPLPGCADIRQPGAFEAHDGRAGHGHARGGDVWRQVGEMYWTVLRTLIMHSTSSPHLPSFPDHKQVRSKLMMGGPGMGMPVEVTSGGNALKFYASLRLHIKRVAQLKQGEKVSNSTSGGIALKFYASLRLQIKRVAQLKQVEKIVGNRVRVTVNKNKLAPPFRTAEFDIEFNHGISREGELLDLEMSEGLLTLTSPPSLLPCSFYLCPPPFSPPFPLPPLLPCYPIIPFSASDCWACSHLLLLPPFSHALSTSVPPHSLLPSRSPRFSPATPSSRSLPQIVGNRVRVTVNKNKLAPPFRTAEFDIEFGHGISREGELLDLGVKEGLLTLSGAWYKKGGEVIGQGKEGARNFLKENVEVARELEEGIRERLGGRKREGDGEGKKGGVEGGKGVESGEGGGEEGSGEETEGEEIGLEVDDSTVVTGVSG